MHKYLGVICSVACTVLLSGCRTEYLVDPILLQEALKTTDRLQQSGQAQRPIAVRVQPVLSDDQIAGQPQYVRLDALQVEEEHKQSARRVSSYNRESLLKGGGVLLGLGLVSILAGALVTGRILSQPCSGDSGNSCSVRSAAAAILGGSIMGGGALEIIPGAILLGLGAPQVEVQRGDPGIVYVPAHPAASAAGTLPAGLVGLRAGLRF